MKLRIVLGSVLWTLLITLLHLWANVGFERFGEELSAWAGVTRPRLRVAFLPVT